MECKCWEETDRKEKKTWGSLGLSECPCGGLLEKRVAAGGALGLRFCGVQDAACLIQPFLGRVLWRWRAPVLLSTSQLVPVGNKKVDCW